MKLLWVITVLKRAGAEQSLLNLAPELLRRGYEIEVLAVRPPHDLAPQLRELGLSVHQLDAGRNPLVAVYAIARHLRRARPDIVHAHLFWAAFCAGVARFAFPQARGVATYHNLDYELFPATSLGARAAKAVFGALMRSFAGHTGVSRAVSAHIKSHLNLRHVETIPNAFDTRRLAPDTSLDRLAVRARYNVPPDVFALIMPARLVPEKGQRDAIEAVARLERGRVHLLICGNGPEREALERRVSARALESEVTFLEPLPHEQLFPLMQACDAFVLASHVEGFGMAAAEAMALGVPVIATDIAGARDVCTPETSLLVPPRDAFALAHAVETLMKDAQLRANLAARGREHVVQNFDLERVAQRWDAFYRALS